LNVPQSAQRFDTEGSLRPQDIYAQGGWNLEGLAQLVAHPKTGAFKLPDGTVSIFANPAAAYNDYIHPFPISASLLFRNCFEEFWSLLVSRLRDARASACMSGTAVKERAATHRVY
jgi:hypothetical protein